MTTTTHFDELALFQYAEGTSENQEEIAAHVAGCDVCAANISEHRRFVAALSQASVWDKAPAPAPKSRLSDLTAFNTRIAREDAAGAAIVDEAITGPNAWWRTRLRQAENWRTAGVARQLLERIRPMMDAGSPANALRVAELAVEVSNELNVADYPSDFVIGVRAQALRDHAYALAFMGRYADATKSADRAEKLLKQTPLPQYELARLKLVRSYICRALDRWGEAVVHAREAAATFREYGEMQRYIDARVYEATMLHGMGRVKDALAIWLELEKSPDASQTTRVRVLHDIGLTYSDLRHFVKALDYLQRACAEYEMLGIETERIRARWLIGRTLLGAKRVSDAITVLREAWREFDSLELEIDGALVALDLVEALLINRDLDDVPAICRTLLERFARSGMNAPATAALAYLREAVAAGQVTRTLVRHVHKFLRQLPQEPQLLFAPPHDPLS
jgi:tetratricopeptide (TPR) repeat protein